MQTIRLTFFTLLLCFTFLKSSTAQTIGHPVLIEVMTDAKTVSSEHPSYVVVQFKAPKGIWIGVQQGQARTPPATKIVPKEIPGFTFGSPVFPESIEDWVPAKLGKTRVLKEISNIVVPFNVDQSVSPGNYELTFYVTYTPSYNAGKLSTHHKEEYSININVANSSNAVNIPQASSEPVSEDFKVGPKNFDDLPGIIKWLYKPWNPESALVKGLHGLWLDPPGHNKDVRILPFPTASATNITGSSAGLGAALFNSTKDGVMTGSISLTVTDNEFVGSGVNFSAISCPGAYYNYQFFAGFAGEGYRDISLKHENFTVADSKIGYDLTFRSLEEPRWRFFGIGNNTVEENETAYRLTNLNAGLDLYVVAIQNFRFGIGIDYDNYDVGTSFDDLVTDENIGFLQDSPLFTNLLGVNGTNRVGFKVNFIYDHKDQEFASARGFFAKLTLSQNSINDITEEGIEDSFLGLNLNVSQYLSGPSQKWIGLLRAGVELKSESDLPFYTLSSLGGPNSMRAYDFDRFLGQHSAFVSAEMRYTLFKATVLGYPFDFEMGAFVDVGQIFGDSESFGDDLKVDPGITIRMINKPNIGLITSIAFGDDGTYFTGGIGLPF